MDSQTLYSVGLTTNILRLQISNISIVQLDLSYFLKLKIYLANEFNESATVALFEMKFDVRLLHHEILDLSSEGMDCDVSCFKSSSSSYTLFVKLPLSIGNFYRLLISSKLNVTQARQFLILPIISEKVYVDNNLGLNFPFLVSNIRVIPLLSCNSCNNAVEENEKCPSSVQLIAKSNNCNHLYISEHYGKTIGHHVYDCAVVLVYYLLGQYHHRRRIVPSSYPVCHSPSDGSLYNIRDDFNISVDMMSILCSKMQAKNGTCVEVGAGLVCKSSKDVVVLHIGYII